MNPRPLGYEPNELPDCSTPRHIEHPDRSTSPRDPCSIGSGVCHPIQHARRIASTSRQQRRGTAWKRHLPRRLKLTDERLRELTGRTLDSKHDNINGWTTFMWLPGSFFLESRGEIYFKGTKMRSPEIIGYDPSSHDFHSSVYASMSGAVLPYRWDVQGNLVALD